MSYTFAMSDIHGCYEILEENLKIIDLSDKNSKLIFCGDYIDYGENSCKTLSVVKEFTERFPNQAYALMGNHEQMFLDFFNCPPNDIWNFEWLGADKEFNTIKSFVSQDTMQEIAFLKTSCKDFYSFLMKASALAKRDIANNHAHLIKWLKTLRYFYESENQIFVHAGIDEEAGEFWKYGTPDDYFISKYPATFGKFYKDIISGHTSTSALKKDKDFHDVFWDKKSHYFLDGNTISSGRIPILKYDTVTQKYTGIKQEKISDDAFEWQEYTL